MTAASPLGLLDVTLDRVAGEVASSLVILEAWKKRSGHKLSAAHKAAISAALKKNKAAKAGGGGGGLAAAVDPGSSSFSHYGVKGEVGETVKLPGGGTGTISKMQGKAWAAVDGGPKKWYKTAELKPVDAPVKAPDTNAGAIKAAGAAKAYDPAMGKGAGALKTAHPVGSMIKTPNGDFEVTKHTTGYVQVAGGPKKWYTTDELAKVAPTGAVKPADAPAPKTATPAAPKVTPVTTANVNKLMADSSLSQSEKYNKTVSSTGGKIADSYVKLDGNGYKVSTVGGKTQIDVIGKPSEVAKVKSYLDSKGVDYETTYSGSTLAVKSMSGGAPPSSKHAVGDMVKVGDANYKVSAVHNDGSISAHPDGKPFASQTVTWNKQQSDALPSAAKVADATAVAKSGWPEKPNELKVVQTLGGSTGAKLVEGL